MQDKIGELAGKVYAFLDDNGESSMSEIAESVEGSRSKVNMAIGWLAREEKLDFVDKGNGTGIKQK